MSKPILARLDAASLARLKHSAKEAQKLESKWDRAIRDYMRDYTEDFVNAKMQGLPIPKFDLERLFQEHFFDVSFKSLGIAYEEEELERGIRKLARPPRVVIPKTLQELRKMYDQWRKGNYSPKRPKAIAHKIQKEYLKRIHSVWDRHAEEFKEGKVYDQHEVVAKIQKAADVPVARAQTIVRTETTVFYNTARRDYYDESQDVTHYLFVAVRDAATTKWCTTKTTEGKRGRSGLVYRKGSQILDKETPACHWNCRSEILPLTKQVPSHKRLIDDESIQRENVSCHPLPPGWKGGS